MTNQYQLSYSHSLSSLHAIPRAANGALNVMCVLIDNYSHYIAVIWRTAMLILTIAKIVAQCKVLVIHRLFLSLVTENRAGC